jgi:arabinofuranosyltransferase
LLYLCRPDLVLLISPIAFLVMAENRRTPVALAGTALLGSTPALAWTLFSLFYYGFPFPNTAYAKLGTGLPRDELALQGLRYLGESLVHDPLTLAVTCLACCLGFFSGRFNRALAAGILVSLTYVVAIGGDFMSGRYLTVSFLAATVIIARTPLSRPGLWITAGVVFALGLPNIGATLLSGSRYENRSISESGIADERGFYYQEQGLLAAPSGTFSAPDWAVGERSVLAVGGLGARGLKSGPGTHLIDVYALADPLLARLPARAQSGWRIGHFARQLPTDYVTSVARNENVLPDPATADLYDVLRLITRGPLIDPDRLRAIFALNLGIVPIPNQTMYATEVVPRSSSPAQIDFALTTDPEKPIVFGPALDSSRDGFDGHLEILLPRETAIQNIDVSVGGDDYYEIGLARGQTYLRIGQIFPGADSSGFVQHVLTPEYGVFTADRVWIMALSGDGIYTLGQLRISPESIEP